MKRLCAVLLLLLAGAWATDARDLTLPNRPASLKFAAIGDSGTGDVPQYDVGRQMATYHGRFPFEMVIMLGDNVYGSHKSQDFVRKFEEPYRPLIDVGVRFYAAHGNHDDPNERLRPQFNKRADRYYTFVKRNVRFFVLDSNLLDATQFAWVARASPSFYPVTTTSTNESSLHVLRVRRRRPTAQGRDQEVGHDGRGVRSGSKLHADRSVG